MSLSYSQRSIAARYLRQVKPKAPRVTVGGLSEGRFIVAFDLLEEDGKHDVASVTVRYPIPRKSTGKPWVNSKILWANGLPVSVVWDPSGIYNDSFYGYVRGNKITRDYLDPKDKTYFDVQYLCTGTSSPMMSSVSRDWGTVSASYIATAIAKKYGLNPVVDRHPDVQHYAQYRKSDFKFLEELATRTGYRFRVSGPNLYFANPVREFEVSKRRGVASFFMNRRSFQIDSLRRFEIIDGETIDDGGIAAKREITLARGNGKPLKATSSRYQNTAFTEVEGGGPDLSLVLASSDHTPRNYTEAQRLVEADALRNFYWLAATASTAGDARVHPGGVVALNGEAMHPDHKGTWMVKKAHHRVYLHNSGNGNWIRRYDMDLTLGRDTRGADVTREIPAEWLAAVEQIRTTQQNGRWIAQTYGVSSVSV